MDNIHKICRICLEEGALTSIYSTEFAMMPSQMLMMCAKIRVYKTDNLPACICNNCIYRLGVAYHFKQECENSDIRLRQYLGLGKGYGFCNAETNTDPIVPLNIKQNIYLDVDDNDTDDDDQLTCNLTIRKSKRRYQRKPVEEHKKRGPKPIPKLPQTCYECNKTFKCAAQLRMHIRTHTGEKPYSCAFCSRRFAQKYNLQIHERTHTGEKPFQCEICSKQFSALGNFQAHQKIHTGIRDQLCQLCQKSFFTAGDLTKHMVTHSGIKNNHCDVCGKAFSRHRDMQTHKRKLHQHVERVVDDEDDDDILDDVAVGGSVVIDSFKCPDCDKEFVSAGSLSLHFRTHSNNLLNLPTLTRQMPPPPPTHPHVHHYHATCPPPPPSHHDLHAHHHLSINATTMQTNPGSGMTSMSHAGITHMLPPPAPPTATQMPMMHAQRLHPY